MSIVTIAIFLMAALSAAVPIVISDGLSVIAREDDQSLLVLLVGVIFLSGVGIWGLNWVRRQLSTEVIADVILAIRRDGFAAAARQDLAFFDEFNTGRIVSRITSDTQELGEVVVLSIDLADQVFVSVILLGVLFTIEWKLTLTVLAMAPLVVIAALSFRHLARRVTRQSSRAIGEVNKAIQEAVTGIRVAKNFRQEKTIYQEFRAVNEQAYAINVRRAFVLANIFPTLNVLSGIGTAILVYFGGRSAVLGVISIGAWYLFVATVDRFWFPVMNLSAFWSQFQAGLSAAERIFALMDVDANVVQESRLDAPVLKGEILFDKVSFRYAPVTLVHQQRNGNSQRRETASDDAVDAAQILSDFDLRIAAGESIALVGHTGSGKSSLVRLLARFYEYQGGSIWVDGRDIRSFDLASYRRQLGIVSQVPFLFAGTVADNIRYGCPSAKDAEIEAIARRIGDGEWLETLPEGLRSEVGERGNRLSMGQRQLVALTRVLVQDPRIFILDEATASVDPFTESQIQQALNLIMAHSTSIIIAHRLSTVRSADRIIVLSKGEIIEQGSHDALMAAGNHYFELYDTYFRHQSAAYIEERGWDRSGIGGSTTADA